MTQILVIRQADVFSRILSINNYEVVNLPLVETGVLDDLSDFKQKLAEIENYDGIFLTSAQATEILAEKIRDENIRYGGKIYIFGKRSYEILKDENLEIVYDETANTAQEFLEKIAPEKLKNKHFLYVRGEKSLRVVPEFLRRIAKFEETTIYETREIPVETDKIEKLRERFAQNEITATCFFSPSAAESFIKNFGAEIVSQTSIATIGKTTAEFFGRQNLKVDLISPKATAEGFAIELIKFLESKAVEINKRKQK